jgi:hypothetical protein
MTLAFIGVVFLFVWFVVGLIILGGLAYGLYWTVSRWNDDSTDTVTASTRDHSTDETRSDDI